MKIKTIKNTESRTSKYPRLGWGASTGNIYVQTGPNERWVNLAFSGVREHPDTAMIEPLPAGTTIQLTQE